MDVWVDRRLMPGAKSLLNRFFGRVAIVRQQGKVLWQAVIPQVWPQYIAYTLYVLDRNVRMATVVGIVGAGGLPTRQAYEASITRIPDRRTGR